MTTVKHASYDYSEIAAPYNAAALFLRRRAAGCAAAAPPGRCAPPNRPPSPIPPKIGKKPPWTPSEVRWRQQSRSSSVSCSAPISDSDQFRSSFCKIERGASAHARVESVQRRGRTYCDGQALHSASSFGLERLGSDRAARITRS